MSPTNFPAHGDMLDNPFRRASNAGTSRSLVEFAMENPDDERAFHAMEMANLFAAKQYLDGEVIFDGASRHPKETRAQFLAGEIPDVAMPASLS